MKFLGTFLASIFFALSAHAVELSCGFANTYEHFPERSGVQRSAVVDGKAAIKAQYKNLVVYEVEYLEAEKILSSTFTLLEHDYTHSNRFRVPSTHRFTYISGIYDPQVPQVALHCWFD